MPILLAKKGQPLMAFIKKLQPFKPWKIHNWKGREKLHPLSIHRVRNKWKIFGLQKVAQYVLLRSEDWELIQSVGWHHGYFWLKKRFLQKTLHACHSAIRKYLTIWRSDLKSARKTATRGECLALLLFISGLS